MEAAGAVEIFERSVPKYGVRYAYYLGDGDSKGFAKVVEEKPYGDSLIPKKLECINHFEKRLGTRLRKLKAVSKGLGGRGKLTDAAINKLQGYFGKALRSNIEDVTKLRAAIWTMFCHVASSNELPSHLSCGDWCKYRKSEQEGVEYDHRKHFHLPKVVMEAIKPTFRDLSNPKLLEKCLHGKTQNLNESFNSSLWKTLPKSVFVQLDTLMTGAFDALSCYNDGLISRVRIMKELKIEAGKFCLKTLQIEDRLRISKSEVRFESTTKEAREKEEETIPSPRAAAA